MFKSKFSFNINIYCFFFTITFDFFSSKVIPFFSPTEIKQTWGKPVGQKYDDLYGAKNRKDLCCLNRLKRRTTIIPKDVITPELEMEFFADYMQSMFELNKLLQ